MKLPISLDKLLQPVALFLLFALLVTGAIYAVLNDEQRAKEASHLQRDILSAIPSALNANTQRGVTWVEAGKELVALEEKRDLVTQAFQTHFKKPAPIASETPMLTSQRVGGRQAIVIPDPVVISQKISTNSKSHQKKTKKRKTSTCCRCPAQKVKRKKNTNSCG